MVHREGAEIDGCEVRDRAPEIQQWDWFLDASQRQVWAEGFLLTFDAESRGGFVGRGGDCLKRGRSVHGSPQNAGRMRVRKPPDPTNQNVEGREFWHSAKYGNVFVEPRLGPFADEFGGDVKV